MRHLYMVICSDSTVETWSPDFSSSGQANPNWTRVRFRDTILVNSLEWTDWDENPVQAILCDACGFPGCDVGGYVHVSQLEDFVLLTTPQIDETDDLEASRHSVHHAIRRFGAIAIPDSIWQSQFRGLPKRSAYPHANGRALADAWILGPGRPMSSERLSPMLRHRTVGCDTLTIGQAITRVEYWLEFLRRNDSAQVRARIAAPEDVGAKLQTFYFDGPQNEDWVALAVGPEFDYIVLDKDHVLILSDV